MDVINVVLDDPDGIDVIDVVFASDDDGYSASYTLASDAADQIDVVFEGLPGRDGSSLFDDLTTEPPLTWNPQTVTLGGLGTAAGLDVEDFDLDGSADLALAAAKTYADQTAAASKLPMIVVQSAPVTSKTIQHNFPYPPEVRIVDSANREVFVGVTYPDSTHVQITTQNTFSYTAYLK